MPSHHPDCDGYVMHHGVAVEDRQGRTYTVVCVIDACDYRDPEVGSYGTTGDAQSDRRDRRAREAAHSEVEECDWRCLSW